MYLRFGHIADLHPDDSGTLAGKVLLDPITGLNETLVDLAHSLDRVATILTAEPTRCDFLVLAGDAHDSMNPHPNEIRVLEDFILRVAPHLDIYIVPGNHDQPHNPVDASAVDYLKGIPHVTLFDKPGWVERTYRGQRLQIFGLPFPLRSQYLSDERARTLSPEEAMAFQSDQLDGTLQQMIREMIPGIPHLLLAHGTVKGATIGVQPRTITHDILINPTTLEAWDYVALGHIHKRQQIGHKSHYPGGLMRHSFDEEHEDKGWNLVEIQSTGTIAVHFEPNPFARAYHTMTLSEASQSTPAEGIVYRLKDQIDKNDYEKAKEHLQLIQQNHPLLQLNVEVIAPDRIRDEAMRGMVQAEDAVAHYLNSQKVETIQLSRLLAKHQRLAEKLPA